jgi:signal transduction histidine kinase
LIRARDLAQQASQAKSQFLATMSHELRTPLNPILGFADLLAESPNLTDEQQVWLRIITQRGQDLLALIGSVLDLAKIEAKKIIITREPLLLRQTVRDLVESFLPAASKKHLHLEWAVESELPDRVLADGFRLHQVLMNLLNNALKFTHQGGIDVRVQDGRAARLMREPSDGESALLFRIQDTGIGIATDRQEVVFEAFTHANQHDAVKYGGAGLGLAIASQLVELMGGRIWVESTPGKGSTFLFTILVGLSREAGTQGATGSGAV